MHFNAGLPVPFCDLGPLPSGHVSTEEQVSSESKDAHDHLTVETATL